MKKNQIIQFSALALLSAGLMLVASCKKKDPVKKVDPPVTAATVDYLKLEGITVKFKNPSTATQENGSFGDTGLTWSGNKGTIGDGDTFIRLGHYGSRVLAKTYKLSALASNEDEVRVYIKQSALLSSPKVNLDGGTYKLERLNGKWVSTITNGTGLDVDDKSKRYNNIEVRMTWPN